jgi:hypothetical protein
MWLSPANVIIKAGIVQILLYPRDMCIVVRRTYFDCDRGHPVVQQYNIYEQHRLKHNFFQSGDKIYIISDIIYILSPRWKKVVF